MPPKKIASGENAWPKAHVLSAMPPDIQHQIMQKKPVFIVQQKIAGDATNRTQQQRDAAKVAMHGVLREVWTLIRDNQASIPGRMLVAAVNSSESVAAQGTSMMRAMNHAMNVLVNAQAEVHVMAELASRHHTAMSSSSSAQVRAQQDIQDALQQLDDEQPHLPDPVLGGSSGSADLQETVCPICQDAIDNSTQLGKFNCCTTVYHVRCMFDLLGLHQRGSCPICRRAVNSGDISAHPESTDHLLPSYDLDQEKIWAFLRRVQVAHPNGGEHFLVNIEAFLVKFTKFGRCVQGDDRGLCVVAEGREHGYRFPLDQIERMQLTDRIMGVWYFNGDEDLEHEDDVPPGELSDGEFFDEVEDNQPVFDLGFPLRRAADAAVPVVEAALLPAHALDQEKIWEFLRRVQVDHPTNGERYHTVTGGVIRVVTFLEFGRCVRGDDRGLCVVVAGIDHSYRLPLDKIETMRRSNWAIGTWYEDAAVQFIHEDDVSDDDTDGEDYDEVPNDPVLSLGFPLRRADAAVPVVEAALLPAVQAAVPVEIDDVQAEVPVEVEATVPVAVEAEVVEVPAEASEPAALPSGGPAIQIPPVEIDAVQAVAGPPLPDPVVAVAVPVEAVVPVPDPRLQNIIVHMNFCTPEEAELIKLTPIRLYAYRGGVLRRAPKAEYFRHQFTRYAWGQALSNDQHAMPFPPYLEELARRCPGNPNHCIVIAYTDPVVHHAPPHQDKSEDVSSRTGCMAAGTGFTVITIADEPFRRFDLVNLEDDNIQWSSRLPNLSMVHITADMNTNFRHQVLPEAGCGRRWSCIFRTIIGGTPEAVVQAHAESEAILAAGGGLAVEGWPTEREVVEPPAKRRRQMTLLGAEADAGWADARRMHNAEVDEMRAMRAAEWAFSQMLQ